MNRIPFVSSRVNELANVHPYVTADYFDNQTFIPFPFWVSPLPIYVASSFWLHTKSVESFSNAYISPRYKKNYSPEYLYKTECYRIFTLNRLLKDHPDYTPKPYPSLESFFGHQSLPDVDHHIDAEHRANSKASMLSATLLVYPSGIKVSPSRLRVKTQGNKSPNRGHVIGFSESSRRRLRDELMKIDWDQLMTTKNAVKARAFFVTLTYPKKYPFQWFEWKRQLEAYRMRLTRAYGSFSAIWKLELQQRGAPHYHFVVIFPFPIDKRVFKTWSARAWSAIADNGSSGKHHKKYGCKVVPVYNHKNRGAVGIMFYLTKYLTKAVSLADDHPPTGRVWGIWFKKNLPIVSPIRLTVYNPSGLHPYHDSDCAYSRFLSGLRSSYKGKSKYISSLSPAQSFTVYGDYTTVLSNAPPDTYSYWLFTD